MESRLSPAPASPGVWLANGPLAAKLTFGTAGKVVSSLEIFSNLKTGFNDQSIEIQSSNAIECKKPQHWLVFSSRFKKLATKEGGGEVSVDREGRNLWCDHFQTEILGQIVHIKLYLGVFSLNSLTHIKSSYLSIGKGKLDPAVVEHLAVAVLYILERRHHVGPHLRSV